jgi:hypothetical protein
MSQTLLTNKKQGNLDQVHDDIDNIIKPTQTRIDRVPYLGLQLTLHFIKSKSIL